MPILNVTLEMTIPLCDLVASLQPGFIYLDLPSQKDNGQLFSTKRLHRILILNHTTTKSTFIGEMRPFQESFLINLQVSSSCLQVDGLYYNLGMSSSGIQLSGGIGRKMA